MLDAGYSMLDKDLLFTDPPPAENLTPETSILATDYWLLDSLFLFPDTSITPSKVLTRSVCVIILAIQSFHSD